MSKVGNLCAVVLAMLTWDDAGHGQGTVFLPRVLICNYIAFNMGYNEWFCIFTLL
jgi:hypothetical protein